MKELYLARHAKSSWKNLDLDDFDRPLNKRGKKAAPLMGEILYGKGVQPDLILSSSAKRAKKTAKILAKKLHCNKLIFKTSIYTASVDELLVMLQKTPEKLKKIMLVGHNPILTDLQNRLTSHTLENIPTAGVVGIIFEVDEWKNIDCGKGAFKFFEYPKKYT